MLAQVTWEVLELLHFQRSGRISLLVVAGEHFPRQFYLFIIWISHDDAPVVLRGSNIGYWENVKCWEVMLPIWYVSFCLRNQSSVMVEVLSLNHKPTTVQVWFYGAANSVKMLKSRAVSNRLYLLGLLMDTGPFPLLRLMHIGVWFGSQCQHSCHVYFFFLPWSS